MSRPEDNARTRARRGHAAAYVAILTAAMAWAFSPVFIRTLTEAYEPFTQACLRYAAAAAVLVAICAAWDAQELRRALLHRGVLLVALLNTIMQAAWTIGCYGATATSASLLLKLQVPAVVLMSYVLFHEERRVIRHPLFLAGTALGLLGVAGVLLDTPGSLALNLNVYTLLLLFAAVAWAGYAVAGRHTSKGLHPVHMFAAVAVYSTLALLPVSLWRGGIGQIGDAGFGLNAYAAFTGILSMALAHATFQYAQKYLGSAFCSNILLISPLITHLVALLIWRDEQLMPQQWLGAGVLLAGSYLVLRAERAVGPA